MTLSSTTDPVYQRAISDGWTNPTDEALSSARDLLLLQYKPLEVIISHYGWANEAEVLDCLSKRPTQRSQVEWICSQIEAVRPHGTTLLAHQMGVQKVNLSLVHYAIDSESLEADKDLLRECNQVRALIVLCQGSKRVLVFSDANDLRSFQQSTGQKAGASLLKRKFPNIPVGLADRQQVMGMLTRVSQSEGATEQDTVKILQSASLRADPTTILVDDLHALAIEAGATDIYVDVTHDSRVAFSYRVRRDVQPMAISASHEDYVRLKQFLVKNSDAMRNSASMRDPADGRYQYVDASGGKVNIRASFIPTQHILVNNEPVVSIRLRLLKMTASEVSLVDSGVRPDVIEAIDKAIRPGQGLVLLVGPTNSGKSTTIAGMIALHRQIYGDSRSRISAEDPVERFLPGVHQFEVALHRRGKDGFQVLSKAFMRHDPDLIFLGEIRDVETAEYAVHFADSGHLVFSTLHAKTPETALQRLINMLPSDKPLLRQSAVEAAVLILGQRLVQRLCRCATPSSPTSEEIDRLHYIADLRGLTVGDGPHSVPLPKQVYRRREGGCDACKNKGVVGLLPINQTLVLTDSLRNELQDPAAKLASVAKKGVAVSFEQMAVSYMEKGLVEFDALMF